MLKNTEYEPESEAARLDNELAVLVERLEQQGKRNLTTLLEIKRLLCRRYGVAEGARRYGELLGSMLLVPMGAQPVCASLRGLHEFAQANHCLEAVFFDHEAFSITAPRQFGKPIPEPLPLQSRCFFLARLENAVIASYSNLILVDGVVLIDYQNEELQHIEAALEYDPWIVSQTEGCLWLTPPATVETLPEAISLIGTNCCSFGHWLIEFLPKVAALIQHELLSGIPIIIDSMLSPTHREALESFIGLRNPIIELPPNKLKSLQVVRLWVCSTPSYVPVLPVSSHQSEEHLSAPPLHIAGLYRTLLRQIPDLSKTGGAERVYLARKPERHRKLVNADEVEALLKQRGFVTVYPEELDFIEQVRLVHAARQIVGPEGSQLILTIFAQPAARLCTLNHPFLENLATFSSYCEALGIETWIILGECVREHPNYRRFSDYRIDLNELAQLLDSWC